MIFNNPFHGHSAASVYVPIDGPSDVPAGGVLGPVLPSFPSVGSSSSTSAGKVADVDFTLDPFAFMNKLNELEQFAIDQQGNYNQSSANAAFMQSMYAQRDAQRYNTEMSNTAFQRGLEDMLKAGLNPALMYSGGFSASTPSSSSASGFQASVDKAAYSKDNLALESLDMISELLQSVTSSAVKLVDALLPTTVIKKGG